MPDRQLTLVTMLQNKAKSLGVEFYFEHPAVRLLREGKGRVTGVIARNTQGENIQINAKKGVILCTGDYGNNLEMVKHFFHNDPPVGMKTLYTPPVNTGDGHCMAMWIGADLDKTPHTPVLFDYSKWNDPRLSLVNIGRQPWLYVNDDGERFMNEDLPWGYESNQILTQKTNSAWSVWDSNYAEYIPIMHSQCCKNMGPPTDLWREKWFEEEIKNRMGISRWENTFEELAKKMVRTCKGICGQCETLQ
jgi:fumarate reductase flavoprotein subunit